MDDFILAGMAFPGLFKAMVISYLIYKVLMEIIKYRRWWPQVWHKPLFCFSLWLIGLSLVCYWGDR